MKWEYGHVIIGYRAQSFEVLNQHGAEGWEMYAVTDNQSIHEKTFYMKRPLVLPEEKSVEQLMEEDEHKKVSDYLASQKEIKKQAEIKDILERTNARIKQNKKS